jgi:hypothetical protein
MGRALSAYSKPIIATNQAAVPNHRILMQIQFSDHTTFGHHFLQIAVAER